MVDALPMVLSTSDNVLHLMGGSQLTTIKVYIMATQTITIRVSPEAAQAYEAASADQQRKLDALLSIRLSEVVQDTRDLEEIMSDISRNAQERGLTSEMLESILDERAEVADMPVSQSHQRELDRRLKNHDSNSGNLLSLEELQDRVKNRK